MKRNLKAIIAAVLAGVMSFSGITAFAAVDTSAELEWDYYGEYYYYDYAGELIVGENPLGSEATYYPWYTFNAQSAGFYAFSYNTDDADLWIGVPDSYEDGTAYDLAERLSFYESDLYGTVFYFEAGENIVAFDIDHVDDNATITVEYYGGEIKSLESYGAYIIDYDIYSYEDEDGVKHFSIDAESDSINVTFTSGKTISIAYIYGTLSNDIKPGINTVHAELFGKKFDMNVSAYLTSEIIESVEISNIEDYLTVTEYYNGYGLNDLSGETLSITFKGGQIAETVLGEGGLIYMPNCREVWCYTDYVNDHDKLLLRVYVANNLVASYECTVVATNTQENIDILNETNAHHLSMVSYYFRQALISILECDSFDEIINFGAEEAEYKLYWAFEYLLGIFRETFALVSYLVS